MTDISADEFAWLPEQAAEQNVSAPTAQRVTFTTTSGAAVSGIRYGDAAPVVTFLHGAGLNAHTFDTTVLSLGLPALSLDLPGHGDSSWRSDASYAPATMGPEVAEAIAALTDRPQILVGHSLGGMTGAWIAAHRPDLVATFLLVDITPGIERDGGPAVLRAFYEKVEFDSRAEVEAWATGFGMGGSPAALTRGVFHNTRIRPDGVVEWKHHFARLASTALATLDQDTAPVLGETSWDNLSATTAPLTLARGDHGFVSDAAAMRFRERLPHATVIDLAGGHNLQEDDPAALAAVIRSLVIS